MSHPRGVPPFADISLLRTGGGACATQSEAKA